MMDAPDKKQDGVALDWSQWLFPGPSRIFTADEMARAGNQRWPRHLDSYVIGNVVVLLLINYILSPRQVPGWAFPASIGAASMALAVGKRLWRSPTRVGLNVACLSLGGLLGLIAVLLRHHEFEPGTLRMPVALLLTLAVVAASAWWFMVIYRVQQIESRLRELAEQDRNLRLSRQLATAQIQPHFLFNTLASLQHWVDTQDPRAAPTLRAFTQYLRSTLPMFERETLTLAEELQIVRHYLTVMQARLGERLAWAIDADPALDGLTLPPGTLLTLVENAIAHGIEPSLRGGRIEVRASATDDQSILEVRDDGAGLCAEAPEGVGLGNTRARLRHQFGDRARLTLSSLHPGCLARIEL